MSLEVEGLHGSEGFSRCKVLDWTRATDVVVWF